MLLNPLCCSILSDPVIMSQLQNCGPADLGPDGIRSFFSRHRCNQFCDQSWQKPRITGPARYPMRMGTSMAAPLATRNSRNPLTCIQEF